MGFINSVSVVQSLHRSTVNLAVDRFGISRDHEIHKERPLPSTALAYRVYLDKSDALCGAPLVGPGAAFDNYRRVDEHHPVFTTGVELGRVVPYALHGDEGRGLRGKPYLVESWQPIIGVAGPDYTNESSQLA